MAFLGDLLVCHLVGKLGRNSKVLAGIRRLREGDDGIGDITTDEFVLGELVGKLIELLLHHWYGDVRERSTTRSE